MLASTRTTLTTGTARPRALPAPRAFFPLRMPNFSGIQQQQQQQQQQSVPESTQQPLPTQQEVMAQLSQRPSLMAVLPLAAATVVRGGASDMTELWAALSKGVDIYLVLLTVRVLLTWFRNISWTGEPFRTLRTFTDPYLNMFRGIIPAIGGMDLSPMLGFFLLQFLSRQLRRLAMGM